MIEEIRCPNCSWEPDGGEYWQCESCGYEWDMFSTAARCPRCHFQHHNTQCISWAGGCDEINPHLDWYNGIDERLEEIDILKGD